MLYISKNLVGIDFGSSSIKAFKLKDTSKGVILEKFAFRPLIADAIVDGAVMDAISVQETLKDLVSEMKIKNLNASTAVSGHSVIVKNITVNTMSKEELRESIYVEAEQYIPFDVEEVYIDFHIVGPDEKDESLMNVLLVAAKKDQVDEYSNILTNCSLKPVLVDIDSFAIENCYELNYEDDPDKIVALVNLGASKINISILRNRVPVFVRDINLGGKNYTEAIQKELQIDYEEAERLKTNIDAGGERADEIKAIIDGVSEEVCQEVIRSMDFFRNTSGLGEVNKIYLSGGCAKIQGIDEFLNNRSQIEVEIMNPFKNVKISKNVDITALSQITPLSAVGIGLAMRKVGDNQ
ncbi:MAG: type IV pilus assembly protein PilM [Candidatus Schekmanbacteria bacterium]|nr:MAG: type IV pilus assembly protein PilM [Candidatus Schekmanbacteria bacterium]